MAQPPTPRKNTRMYISNQDIEGSQPRKWLKPSKKRVGFFDDIKRINAGHMIAPEIPEKSIYNDYGGY